MTNDHTERGLTPDANGRMLDDLGNEYRNEDGTHERATLNYYDVVVSWRSSGTVPVLAVNKEEAQAIALTLASSGQGIMHDVMPDADSVALEGIAPAYEPTGTEYADNRAEALDE